MENLRSTSSKRIRLHYGRKWNENVDRMVNDMVPKLAINYKPLGKRDIVNPKTRQRDHINGVLNRMNQRLICENSQTLQRTHPHDIKGIWQCHIVVRDLAMTKLNSTCT
jgi:hypothetical protein